MEVYVNGQIVEAQPNQTILEVARTYGHFVPTLCEMQGVSHTPATCRVCLVQMQRKGQEQKYFVTSCNTPIEEGMSVWTRNQAVRERQRFQVELLLADHDQDCATCIRHGNCELQDVAQFVGLKQTRYRNPKFFGNRVKDYSSPSVARDMTKCIRCFRCVTVCRDVQSTDVLMILDKGLDNQIGVRDADTLDASDCVSCGQCSLVCPVGAFAVVDDTETVIDYLYDPDVVTVFQFAPSVRVALGETFEMPAGTNVEGQLISAIQQLGADIVLDTNFTADLVVMEEGTELLHRLKHHEPLPLMTSCSPGWVNFVEKYYPEMIPHLSSVKSPQQCFGAIAKTYLAEKMQIDPQRMRVVSIMPCTAKKGEARRPEFAHNGRPDVDVVITTREFGGLLKREGISLRDLPPGEFNNAWMGNYSGAGQIFGTTGGVMEAALRTVYALVTGAELPTVEFQNVRGLDYLREAEVDLGGEYGVIRVAIAHGLKAARHVVEAIKSGEKEYHFVEVMGCPGGCMNGGGQPRTKQYYQRHAAARQQSIYRIDRDASIRQAHNNPLIQRLYADFLGAPNSHKAHELLHTSYVNRKRAVKHSMKEIWTEIQAHSFRAVEE